jgi:hypothetical protein
LPWSSEDRDEVLFNIETLFRTMGVLIALTTSPPVPQDKASQDVPLSVNAIGRVFWAQMHIHCLAVAIRRKIVVMPEVLAGIINGTGSSDAYSYAQQAYDLRLPAEEIPERRPLDKEDTELLQAIAESGLQEP